MKNYGIFTPHLLRSLLVIALTYVVVGCQAEKTSFHSATISNMLTAQEEADLKSKTARSFTAGSLVDEVVTIDTGFNLVEHQFTLRQAPKTKVNFQQISRNSRKVEFQQGFDGWPVAQSFKASENGKLDLLLVIDDSPSMKQPLEKLSKGLAPLLSHIGNTNWQIAVVTTSTSCLRETKDDKTKILTRADYDANRDLTDKRFAELVSLDSVGKSMNERGLLHAIEGLRGDCGDIKKAWRRPMSSSAVFIVTDEKNCGSADNEGCPDDPDSKADYFFNETPADTQVFGLLLLAADGEYPDTALCPESGGYESQWPATYIEVIERAGGIYDEICQPDYSPILEKISEGISKDTIQQYELQHIPEKTNFRMWLDGKELLSGYELIDNFVIFREKLPMTASTLEVSYYFNGKERSADYALPSPPDVDTLEVHVNNILLDAREFYFDARTNMIHFVTMPQDLAEITVEYRDLSPLPKDFLIPNLDQDVLPDSIEVLVRGKKVEDFTYEAASSSVIFHRPPFDNAKIEIAYARIRDKVTQYPVAGVKLEKIEGVDFVDAITGSGIAGKREGNRIFIPAEEVYDGRAIVARYNILYEGTELDFVVPLPHGPLTDSVTVLAAGSFDLCSNNLMVNKASVSFSCIDDNFLTIAVNYKYVADYRNTFVFEGIFSDKDTWQVYVNGKEIFDYQRQKDLFTIAEKSLPPGADVIIARTPKSQVTEEND